MDKTKLQPKKEKFCFKIYRAIVKSTKKKVKFNYLGKHFENGTLILSNHESTKGPFAWDFFCDKKVRFLGAEEMNSGLRKMYKYQSEVYYHQKKHWPLFLAKMFCLLASPMTNLYYKGLDLISIREGFSFKHTIKDAYTSLVEYKENLVIFPEDSSTGYHKELISFKRGFILICRYALKHGDDLPIVVGYYNKEKSTITVGEPVLFSELQAKFDDDEKLAEYLKDECNRLGKISYEEIK